MHGLRTLIAVLLAVLTLAVPALAVSGCGSTGHVIGGIVAHKALNHAVGTRNANKVFCLYHGHRVLVDLRNHHVFGAGINAYLAYRSCRGGFGHRHH